MKLCYIISDIDKSVNLELTAIKLRDSGITPIFILINCKGIVNFLESNGFTCFSLQAGNILSSKPQIKAVAEILKNQRITCVHCHLGLANWIGLHAAKRAGVKHRIFTRHSGKPLHFHWKEWIIDRIQNRLASKIVSISPAITSFLRSQHVPAKKIVNIPHGFDLNRFINFNSSEVERIRNSYNQHNQQPIIGVIARWMEWKGIQYIIPAFERILVQHPNAKLVLFGGETGDYANEISNMLNKLPPNSWQSVRFEYEVFDLYQLFDVYVHVPVNANCEAFGQTYIEALAAGIPSVFTSSGIAQSFIRDKQEALVVPFQDSDAIYSAVAEILNNKVLQTNLSENGRKRVSELFSFDRYNSDLIQLYSNC